MLLVEKKENIDDVMGGVNPGKGNKVKWPVRSRMVRH